MEGLYVGQRFEWRGLQEKDGTWPETDRFVQIHSISMTGNVFFQIGIVEDPAMVDRALNWLPLERVALLRAAGYWRTNSNRWPEVPGV